MPEQIRVLVVDDDERFARNMARLLKNRGFAAAPAFDGYQALGRISQEAYDVLVLDIKMPGMDGLSCLKEIKAVSPETQVIILTGHASYESGIEAVRSGAFDYLMKPCEVEELAGKIHEAYRLSAIRKQPLLWPRTIVKEVNRTDFQPVRVHDPVTGVLGLFDQSLSMVSKFELHVTDEKGTLQGVISKQDILREAGSRFSGATWDQVLENPGWLQGIEVREIMQPTSGILAGPEESLLLVAKRMLDNAMHCLPVVDQGKLLGIIRLKEVLQYVAFKAEEL